MCLLVYGFDNVIKSLRNKLILLASNSNVPKACGEIKNLNSVAANTGGLGECDVVDVEDFIDAGDVPVPMFVKHTEAILDETDLMVCISI